MSSISNVRPIGPLDGSVRQWSHTEYLPAYHEELRRMAAARAERERKLTAAERPVCPDSLWKNNGELS